MVNSGTARGDVRPKRQGGDRHSQRIEAHAELILSALAAKSDITLSELRKRLKRHGVAVAIGTLSRFFKHARSRAKKLAHAAEQRRSAVNAGHVRRGLKDNSTSIRRGSSSSTKTAANTKMARLYVVRPGASDAAPPCPMAIGKPPLSPPGCARPDRCAHGP